MLKMHCTIERINLICINNISRENSEPEISHIELVEFVKSTNRTYCDLVIKILARLFVCILFHTETQVKLIHPVSIQLLRALAGNPNV